MPVNLIAGDSSNLLQVVPAGDTGLNIQVGPSGAKVVGLAFNSNGIVTTPAYSVGSPTTSSIVLGNPAGTTPSYGTTRTANLIYGTVYANNGSDLTYVNSATLGSLITVVNAGVYGVTGSGGLVSSGRSIMLMLNDTLGVAGSWPANSILAVTAPPGNTGATQSCSWAGYLPAGSVISIRIDSTSVSPGTAQGRFAVTRLGQ